MPWNTQRPRPLPTAPVRYPTQRRCFATRSTRQCGGAVGGAVSRGHSPPHSSLRGRGVAGRGRPSQALPSPGPGEAKPELRRAGQGSSMHRPRRSRVRSGAERRGAGRRPGPPGSAVTAHMATAALLAALPRRGLLLLRARYGRGWEVGRRRRGGRGCRGPGAK